MQFFSCFSNGGRTYYYNNFAKPLMPIAISLFAYAALFQLADGMRIALFSILRGMKDTQFTLMASFIQFWLIAMPISYYLAFVKLKAPEGLWIGLILSGFVGTLILWRRLKIVGARQASPLQ